MNTVYIPDFQSTNEAIAFGKVASVEEVKTLRLMKIKHDVEFDRFLEEEDFDQANIVATKSQFCRKAIEVYFGILNIPECMKV